MEGLFRISGAKTRINEVIVSCVFVIHKVLNVFTSDLRIIRQLCSKSW